MYSAAAPRTGTGGDRVEGEGLRADARHLHAIASQLQSRLAIGESAKISRSTQWNSDVTEWLAANHLGKHLTTPFLSFVVRPVRADAVALPALGVRESNKSPDRAQRADPQCSARREIPARDTRQHHPSGRLHRRSLPHLRDCLVGRSRSGKASSLEIVIRTRLPMILSLIPILMSSLHPRNVRKYLWVLSVPIRCLKRANRASQNVATTEQSAFTAASLWWKSIL